MAARNGNRPWTILEASALRAQDSTTIWRASHLSSLKHSLGSHGCRVGGSSELNQGNGDHFQAAPPMPVRLLVNRSGAPRSSGYTHGPDLRLPPHCQACQRSLTRKRSLVQIQYRPPARYLVSGTFAGLPRTPCYQVKGVCLHSSVGGVGASAGVRPLAAETR